MLGQHHDVVVLAEAAVDEEPLRERRWASLILALYRCGRQADALRAYQRLRKLLETELGIEPSSELVALDAAIIRQDPGLDSLSLSDMGTVSVRTPQSTAASAIVDGNVLEPCPHVRAT
jgi:DNA-binding SARP family transcriptional activator